VPADAYYGSFTTRALKNFQISQATAPCSFKKALACVKYAAAQTNTDLKKLDSKLSKAIIAALREFIAGKFDHEYTIDIFQAGAGTPYNMNLNEIIANRANELLDSSSKKGSYKPINPNNHVNMAQSSNDVIPTALRIAVAWESEELQHEMKLFVASLRKKAKKFAHILKVGRTHLQDAVPVTLGQEFTSFAVAVEKDLQELKRATSLLYEIGLGGTALGTGINTHVQFQKLATRHLSKLTNLKLKPTKNLFETTSNMNPFASVSASMRNCAITMQRIAQDLKLLNMGPLGGIGEITLPEVEPGSSIMPGKVNPSVAECLQMIAFQVQGNDRSVELGVMHGQLELNVMTPLILKCLTENCQLLTNGFKMFREYCIDGIVANEKRCRELLEKSLCVATGLNPYLGYHTVAQLVNEALRRKTSLETLILEKKLMPSEKLRVILDPKNLTQPNVK
jgi:aspartate ammonia-lyase